MKFKLKKDYRWYDLLTIPYYCCPIATIALGAQKLLTALAAVLQVSIMAKFIDTVDLAIRLEGVWSDTLLWFILLVICVGWRRISFMVGKVFISYLRIMAVIAFGQVLTDKCSKLHYSLIESEESWNLITRVCRKPEEQVRLMAQRTFNLLLYIIRIFGVLYIVFTNVWWIGVLTGIFCVPLVYLSLKSGEKNYKSTKRVADYERRYHYLSDILSGREAVNERNLFGFTEKINKDWFDQYEETRKIKLKANIQLASSIRGGSAAITFLSSIIIITLVFPTVNGEISYGMFIALSTGMYDLVNMVGVELTKAVSQLSQCREFLRDLSTFASLDEVPGIELKPDIDSIMLNEIEFKGVSFKYPGAKTYTLNNVSFKIFKNGHYAFVGTNGAGKTTITKLLTALYDDYRGEILINGKEMRSYSQSQIKAMFCGVYQDFSKYHISIEDNILIGDINHIDTHHKGCEVKNILEKVDLYEKVQNLPLGIKTPLGKILEGGIDLSGGQWQKLAMARAMINNAPVLILDEPTAALDPLSESKMYEEYGAIGDGRTTIFISHRLGSTKLADKIFVLDDGRIVEEGSHRELMGKAGLYADMYESQRGWYK